MDIWIMFGIFTTMNGVLLWLIFHFFHSLFNICCLSLIIYSWRSHANAPLHVMKSEIVLTCVKTWRPRPSLCLVRNELWCTNFLKLFGPLTLFCVCNFQIVRNGRRDSGTQITDGKVASMVIESTSRAYCESAAQTGKFPYNFPSKYM